ncbi:hypothetical protein Q8A73_014492 [Channa argus]|nr:hypothetical protein Q8A73_014492 [Channa argus]
MRWKKGDTENLIEPPASDKVEDSKRVLQSSHHNNNNSNDIKITPGQFQVNWLSGTGGCRTCHESAGSHQPGLIPETFHADAEGTSISDLPVEVNYTLRFCF